MQAAGGNDWARRHPGQSHATPRHRPETDAPSFAFRPRRCLHSLPGQSAIPFPLRREIDFVISPPGEEGGQQKRKIMIGWAKAVKARQAKKRPRRSRLGEEAVHPVGLDPRGGGRGQPRPGRGPGVIVPATATAGQAGSRSHHAKNKIKM